MTTQSDAGANIKFSSPSKPLHEMSFFTRSHSPIGGIQEDGAIIRLEELEDATHDVCQMDFHFVNAVSLKVWQYNTSLRNQKAVAYVGFNLPTFERVDLGFTWSACKRYLTGIGITRVFML